MRREMGGQRWQGSNLNGWFYSPMLFAEVQPSMRIAQEEIFGPVISMIRVASLDEAVRINNQVTRTTGAEIHLPFGGTRGIGNVTGKRALPHLTFLPNGNRCTWATAGDCNGRKSTTRIRAGHLGAWLISLRIGE